MVVFTERAIKEIRRQISLKPQNTNIRFGLQAGGCQGYSYYFQFDYNEPKKHDNIIDYNEFKILIDPKSITLLSGTTVDFETGLRGHGFKFMNDNVKSICGCGDSINIEKNG